MLDVDMRIPHKVFGDIVRIRQIMLNLLNNAVKVFERGEIEDEERRTVINNLFLKLVYRRRSYFDCSWREEN